MKKILVIGGGAMGSAFTIPCIEKKNDVTITEPYSKRFIRDLSSKKKIHSALKIRLPKKLKFRKFSDDLLKEKSREKEEEQVSDDSYWVETIFNNVRVNIGDFSKWVLNSKIKNSPLDLYQEESLAFKYNDLYEINQEIKVDENKYHFIDHPYFGIIVRISPLQTN